MGEIAFFSKGYVMWTTRFNKLSSGFAEVSGWLIVPMMGSIFLDAVLRGLFNVALLGIVESNSMLLVAIVYLGLAGAQASGAHFRVTLLSDRVPYRLRQLFIGLGFALVLVTVVILFWFTFQSAIFSFKRDEISYGLIDFPLWPSRALIAFGFALLLAQMLVDGLLFVMTGEDPFARKSSVSETHPLEVHS